jgi:hypothetical protein
MSEEKKYSGGNFDGPDHSSPYPVSRLGAPVSLVDTAKLIESASATVAMRTNAQLEVIVEQIRALQEQAKEIVERAGRDIDLIHAECRFRRVPGRIYHLYEKAGHRYFSMVAPDEFGYTQPGFVASFRYEHDESWTRVDEIAARDERRARNHRFATTKLLAD